MLKSLTANFITESVENTVEFYTQVLGFQEYTFAKDETEKKIFTIIGKDSSQIMFQLKESLHEEYSDIYDGEIKPTFTLYLIVDNFEEYHNEIKGKVKFVKEIHTTPYGAEEFAIFDNNNYILTIAKAQND